MAGASIRRPIPAVVFILLLSLLSAIVWYRVLNRSPASTPKATPPTSTHACPPKPATKTTVKAGAKASPKPAGKTTPKAPVKAIVWPKTSAVRVSVLNGSQRNGLAKSVAAQLKSRGFAIGTVTNDKVTNLAATQVRYGAPAATAAKLLQLYLPGSTLVANSSKATTVTVSLGSAYTHLSTNAAVAKAKKSTTSITC